MLQELSHKQKLNLLPRCIEKLTRKQKLAVGARLMFQELKMTKSSKAFATMTIKMQTYY